jgi:PTS system mannose-specific IIA component
MSVNILIISHNDIGAALVKTATKVFDELPLPTTVVNIEADTDPEILLPKLRKLVKNIGANAGILILTDLFGSTPSNIAKALKNNANIRIVCGLNLPMLMRVMNYPNATIDELAEKALSGGREGVIEDKT